MWVPSPALADAKWRKSSRSQGAQSCVEVAKLSELAVVRDSKAPTGPALLFKAPQWSSFMTAVKRGQRELS
jgi:hypothetical protein